MHFRLDDTEVDASMWDDISVECDLVVSEAGRNALVLVVDGVSFLNPHVLVPVSESSQAVTVRSMVASETGNTVVAIRLRALSL